MPHINHNTFMPVPPNGHLKWPFEVPGSWWVIYDGHLFYSTCSGDGNLNFYSINRSEQVMLRCLISWLNHPWLYRSAPNNADHTGFMWVGGWMQRLFIGSIQFFFLPKQRMGQRSCLWQEKSQFTSSTGTMLPKTFSVIWHPSVYRRKCPKECMSTCLFCVLSCSWIWVLNFS